MPFYVEAKINGRCAFYEFARWCQERNITDAEYFSGGWMDKQIDTVLPHVKFEKSEDAVAFALSSGLRASSTLPVRPRENASENLSVQNIVAKIAP